MAKAKYFGADGEIRFLADRNVWIGFMGGKVVATRNNRQAVANYLAGYTPKKKVTKTTSTKVDSNIHTTLTLQVAEVWRNAMQIFPEVRTMLIPKVEFYSRGRTAGKAWWTQHKVAFNDVLASENQSKFMNTVIHEVAHIVTHKLFPQATAHGREFKMVMRKLGGDGERCHTYDVSSVRVTKTKKRYVYTCGCQEHKVTSNVHNKVSIGRTFRCKNCGGRIQYTGKVVTFI